MRRGLVWRAVTRGAVAATTAGALVASVVATLPAKAAPGASDPAPSSNSLEEENWSFQPSGLDGAGMQNVIAVNPSDPSQILLGGDVAGVHRSSDRGTQFTPSTEGMWQGPHLHVASLVFHPTEPNTVYAATGIQGKNGGLFESTDGGHTWELLSDVPKYGADNNTSGSPVPNPHPRSTGDLVAVAPNGDLYTGTYKNGLMKSSDGGSTWTTIDFNGDYIRGIALDPDNSNILYVAVYDKGVFAITNPSGSATKKKLNGTPTTPEEIAIVNKVMYVPAGTKGLFSSTGSGANRTLSKVSGVPTNGSAAYMSVAGHKPADGPAVIFTGCWTCTKVNNSIANSIYRSVDGGSTWQSVTDDPDKITYVPRGGDRNWWLLDAQPSMALGKGSYIAAQIAIDPQNPDNVYVAGRSGAWASADGGDSWEPIVRGLGATIPRGSDSVNDYVAVALADWVLVYSVDGGKNFSQAKPPQGNVGYATVIDERERDIYVGVGERDSNTHGDLWRLDIDSRQWVSEGLGSKTGNKRVLAAGLVYDGDTRVLLAGVEASGVWRKEGNGAWTQVSGDLLSTSGGSRKIPRATSVINSPEAIYVYDPQRGVYRSKDIGVSFQRIWNQPATKDFQNFLGVDPTDPDTVYVSDGNDLWRLDGALSGTVEGGGISTTALDVPKPGPLFVDSNGNVAVVRGVAKDRPTELLRSEDRGETWVPFADDVIHGLVASVTGQSIFYNAADLVDSRWYILLDGMGLIVGGEGGGGSEPPQEDSEAPEATISQPEHQALLEPSAGDPVTISGEASDNVGVAKVKVSVKKRGEWQWLHPDGTFADTFAALPADVSSAGDPDVSWSIDVDLPTGEYGMQALAIDGSGNKALSSEGWVKFDVTAAVADEQAPETTTDIPQDGDVLQATGDIVSLTGGATDDVGVTQVSVAVQRRGDKQWLQPDGSFGNAYTSLPAVVDPVGGTEVSWTADLDIPAGEYGMHAFAADASGKQDTSKQWRKFDVAKDEQAPETSTDVPQGDAKILATADPVSFSGEASDDVGVAQVSVAVQRRGDKQWLQPDGSFGNAYKSLPAVVDPIGGAEVSWTAEVDIPAGEYGMHAFATDAAGNEDTSKQWRKFDVVADEQAPETVTDVPENNEVLSASGGVVALSGTATDDVGVAEVAVAVQRRGDKKWLQPNGSFGNAYKSLPAEVDPVGGASVSWTANLELPDGEYGMHAFATDVADKQDASKEWLKFDVE